MARPKAAASAARKDLEGIVASFLEDFDFASGAGVATTLREVPRFVHDEEPVPVEDPEEVAAELEGLPTKTRVRLVRARRKGERRLPSKAKAFRMTRVGMRNAMGLTEHPGSDVSARADFTGPTLPAWLYRIEGDEFNPETKLRAYARMRQGRSFSAISKETRVPVETLGEWERIGIENGLVMPRANPGRTWVRLPGDPVYVGTTRPSS